MCPWKWARSSVVRTLPELKNTENKCHWCMEYGFYIQLYTKSRTSGLASSLWDAQPRSRLVWTSDRKRHVLCSFFVCARLQYLLIFTLAPERWRSSSCTRTGVGVPANEYGAPVLLYFYWRCMLEASCCACLPCLEHPHPSRYSTKVV